MQETHGSAIIAARGTDELPDTDEITSLAEAAGYEVVDTITQRRSEDATYQLGRGKADELAGRVETLDADGVIFDNPLSPQQTYRLGELFPDGVGVVDRYRLIIDIFGQQAGTRRAQLEVRLAELRYELPRVKTEIRIEMMESNERLGGGGGGPMGEAGIGGKEHRRIRDIDARMQRIEAELGSLGSVEADRRERQREDGFDLVALAGYTNAGKSTLLQRLATDLDLADNDHRHADETKTAEAEDRLFETLDTTTRRADFAGRRALVTDTVGFVRDLPPWLVDSFESTLSAAYRADAVLVVVDASDSVDEARAKLTTSLDTLEDEYDGEVVVVLNKTDLRSTDELADLRRGLSDLTSDPVLVSAVEGDGIGALTARVKSVLPSERERFRLPNGSEAQSVLSWAYDRGHVSDVAYDGDEMAFTVEARPTVVARVGSKVAAVDDGAESR